MKTFNVNISVIECYLIEVNADTEKEAIQTAQDSSIGEIRKYGKQKLAETDYAEIAD